MVGPHRLNEIINGDGLVTGLEEFLELAFGVSLFGQLFCKGQPLSVGLANPKAGGIVPSILKDGAEDGFPRIGEGARGLVNFLAGGISTHSEKKG